MPRVDIVKGEPASVAAVISSRIYTSSCIQLQRAGGPSCANRRVVAEEPCKASSSWQHVFCALDPASSSVSNKQCPAFELPAYLSFACNIPNRAHRYAVSCVILPAGNMYGSATSAPASIQVQLPAAAAAGVPSAPKAKAPAMTVAVPNNAAPSAAVAGAASIVQAVKTVTGATKKSELKNVCLNTCPQASAQLFWGGSHGCPRVTLSTKVAVGPSGDPDAHGRALTPTPASW